jgi:hypothetical protein
MDDLKLAVLVSPEDGYERSTMLLARATCDGRLELRTYAWERLLGYGRCELQGKLLGALLAAERRFDNGEQRVVAALFDRGSGGNVDLTLRCRGGSRQSLTLHRRFDAASGTIYIVGEEFLPARRVASVVEKS